jgi:hypothetical protein
MTQPPREPSQPGGPSQPNADRDETIARLKQALAEAREQLRRVSIERDELRQQLARIDGMQTATVTLPNEPTSQERQAPAALPSIEDLMASLNDMKEPSAKRSVGHLHMRVQAEANADDSEDMLSPVIVFPEQYAATAQTAGSTDARIKRVLVLLDGEQPIKFPLYKEEMIIGRAESADIHIDSHFISRLHARLVLTDAGVIIEDFESKNGIKINSKLTNRQTLRHGDLLNLGGLRFRFLDTAADDAG